MPGEPLLSLARVAAQLGVCRTTAYRLCERGELPHIRVSNAIRVSPDAFAAYLKAAGYRGRPTSTDSAAPAERASLRFPTRPTPGSRRQGTIFAMLFAVFSVNHMFPSGPRVML